MLKPQTLTYLTNLREHNDRLWFKEHRKEYEGVREDFKQELDTFTQLAVKIDPDLKDAQIERHIFRINRDVRFSKNKRPYKSHMSWYVSPGWKANKDFRSCYYLRVEPFNSFVWGWNYAPSREYLDKIRQKILTHWHELEQIISEKKFVKYYGELGQDNKLKTWPKWYPKDHKYIELLKYKNYSARSHLSDADIESPDSHKEYKKRIKAIEPLIAWLNSIYI